MKIRVVIYLLMLLIVLSACDTGATLNVPTGRELPGLTCDSDVLYAAKVHSTWGEGDSFYCLLENGQLYVYPVSKNCDLDTLLADAKQLQPIYAALLTDLETESVKQAIADIDCEDGFVVQLFDNPYTAVDGFYVTSYIGDTKYDFKYGDSKNNRHSHVLELLTSYSTNTFLFDIDT